MAEIIRAELRFQRGDATADQIQDVVDEVLRELADPGSDAAREARAADLDPGQLAGAQVTVAESGQGLDPFTASILVGIVVSLASKAAESLWEDVLWPRIRKRLGATALKEGEAAPPVEQAARDKP
jgi:hypothetical protein